MKRPFFQQFILIIWVINISSCITTKNKFVSKQAAMSSLHLIAAYDIPYNLRFMNTTVGGLSGIDRDTIHNCYYFICDDRSALEPSRFYTANITLSDKGIDRFYFTNVQYLLQRSGEVYPSMIQDPLHVTDPESIRYYAPLNQLIWTSEGERILNKKDTVLSDPTVTIMSMDGKWIDGLAIPPILKMNFTENGPRRNGVLEAITLYDDYKKLFLAVEMPLYEDGPVADTINNNATIRMLEYDLQTKNWNRQYAYKLEPVAYPPTPSSAFRINGISEILAVDNSHILVVERSYSTGRLACSIKVFLADFSNATDISHNPSLKENTGYVAAQKKLLLKMDDLGIYIDNIEGVTFGPTLPNGNRTLLFVADNNFNSFEKSQLLFFEIR